MYPRLRSSHLPCGARGILNNYLVITIRVDQLSAFGGTKWLAANLGSHVPMASPTALVYHFEQHMPYSCIENLRHRWMEGMETFFMDLSLFRRTDPTAPKSLLTGYLSNVTPFNWASWLAERSKSPKTMPLHRSWTTQKNGYIPAGQVSNWTICLSLGSWTWEDLTTFWTNLPFPSLT